LALALQSVAALLPSKASVMVAYATKPLPLTAILLPTLPVLELRLMDGLLPVFVAWPEDVRLAGGAGFVAPAKVEAV
jgi:hypothetical protein